MWLLRRGLIAGRGALDAAPAGGASFSVTATANATDTSASSPVTFSGLSVGAADSTRVVAVAVGSRNAGGVGAISGITIGGVSATKACAINGTGGDTSISSEIWYAAVPTGTTANVVVTYTGGSYTRSGIQVFAIIAPGNSGAPTATGTGNAPDVSDNIDLSAAMTVPSGGSVLGVAFCLSSGPGTPTGSPAGFNLRLNNNIAGAQQVWALSSAAGAFSGSQTIRTTLTGLATDTVCFAGAAWGP